MPLIDRVLNIVDRCSKHSLLRRRAARTVRRLTKKAPESVSILFVCKGNICRSAYAAAQLKQRLKNEGLEEAVQVYSAGLQTADGRPANEAAVKEAACRGLNLGEHITTRLTKDLLQKADLIVLMDGANYVEMRKRLPGGMKKVLFLGALSSPDFPLIISDPFGRDTAVFCACFNQIDSALDSLFAELKRALVPA